MSLEVEVWTAVVHAGVPQAEGLVGAEIDLDFAQIIDVVLGLMKHQLFVEQAVQNTRVEEECSDFTQQEAAYEK